MKINKLALALVLSAPFSVFADDDGPCKYATKGESPVVQACKQGGRAAAEDVMKKLVKSAKANGLAFKCNACHEDMDSFKLKDTAGEDFKKLLAAANKK
jgi:hypothetical protein